MAAAFVAWTAVTALVFAAAGVRAGRAPARSTPHGGPMVVDVVLDRAAADGPALWLSIAAGPRRCLMRARITDADVTVETDLTAPPSLRRYAPPDPIVALARRLLWVAADDARAARAGANALLALVLNDVQSSPKPESDVRFPPSCAKSKDLLP